MKKYIKRTFFSFLILILAIFLVSCKDNDVISTKYTDELKLEADYEGKNFLTDGIGLVTLFNPVDGDTAHFVGSDSDTIIKVRFLGINTPESTGQIAPWGFQASEFTKSKLKNAVEIVLEAEELGKTPALDSTGGRYLAYVWYRTSRNSSFRNLNLEIIEHSYSMFTDSEVNLKYGIQFENAYKEVYEKHLRVNGERDPEFDYSGDILNVTVAILKENLSSYATGANLSITVRVVRCVGNSLYVEDVEAAEGESYKAGIFMYHSNVKLKYKPGDIISLTCQASNTENYGLQLVNPRFVRKLESDTELVIRQVPEDVTSLKAYEGLVVQVNEFTVTHVGQKNSDTGAFTIYGTMKNGAEMQVRVDGDSAPKLAYSYPKEGVTYNVIGGVSKYYDQYDDEVIYQIKLGNQADAGINDFVLSD